VTNKGSIAQYRPFLFPSLRLPSSAHGDSKKMNTENVIAPVRVYSPPYTILAPVYDGMMSHVKYKRWAKYVHAILKKEKFDGTALLDVGCGTGEFLNHMSRYNYKLSGCDASADMLNIARKKLPDLPLQVTALPLLMEIPENRFNIAVCLYDTINYILDISDLVESFKSIYRKLKTPGVFIFDVVTRSYCEQFFQNYTEKEVVRENIAYSRNSQFDTLNNVQTNYIQVFTPDGIFEEVHKQKIYNLQLIRDLLVHETPFQNIQALSDFSFENADENSGRVHFIAKKN
jgi:ubiquinone/menaquinone biosynthesis C-methylase UbiE